MSSILIVDDERDIRELIGDILRDEGYTVRLAGNSDDCMAEINAEPPALMILDIWLKDSRMDGIDILKTVKRDNPDVPVVIISGHGNIEIAVAAIKQGAYDFIEKPFNIDQLMVVVARAMETSRLRRENSDLRRRDVTSAEMLGNSACVQGAEGATRKGDEIQRPGDADRCRRARQGNGRPLHPRPVEPRRARPSSRSPPPRSNPNGWKRCCSAAKPPTAAWSRAFWNRPMAASSTSTRWPTCRWAPSPRSCACWSNSSSPARAAPTRCASICA